MTYTHTKSRKFYSKFSNFIVRKRITKYLDVNMFARFSGLTRCFVVSRGVVN